MTGGAATAATGPERARDAAALNRLSPRERQILKGLARGLTNKAIGRELGISHRTVETHCMRLRRKLRLDTAGALRALVALMKDDILPPPA